MKNDFIKQSLKDLRRFKQWNCLLLGRADSQTNVGAENHKVETGSGVFYSKDGLKQFYM